MIAETIPPRVIDLRAWRLRAGYENMTEVARLIGYSEVSAVGRMERGERPIPEERLPLLRELLGPDPPMMNKPQPLPRTTKDRYWTFWWEYTLELFCPHCGRSHDWVVKSGQRVQITHIPRIRCAECGAVIVVAEVIEKRKREPKPFMYEIPKDEVRKGRPRKKRGSSGKP